MLNFSQKLHSVLLFGIYNPRPLDIYNGLLQVFLSISKQESINSITLQSLYNAMFGGHRIGQCFK